MAIAPVPQVVNVCVRRSVNVLLVLVAAVTAVLAGKWMF
jgi:hypothetical protein